MLLNDKQQPDGDIKKELRSHHLRLRRQRNSRGNRTASARILWRLQHHQPVRRASVIHSFLSQDEEPDTLDFIQWALSEGKQVVVPSIAPGHFELTHFRLLSLNDLHPGTYGILEISPGKREPYPLDQLELVLVPGIVFDLQGGRIGYGKGYYDRFLAQTPAFRLGVGFADQIVDRVPMETHDMHLDAMISECGLNIFTSDS